MEFTEFAIDDAEGIIVAHSLRGPGKLCVKKGETVTAELVAALREAGVHAIAGARLRPGDIGENEAARRIAERLAGAFVRKGSASTGRCNLFATRAGVLRIDAAAIDALNEVDEAITAATLPPWRRVSEGEMVATVKIIPFAVDGGAFETAAGQLESPPLNVAPFTLARIGVISTLSPGLKRETIAKTLRNLETRVTPTGARICVSTEIEHDRARLAPLIRHMAEQVEAILIFGASATVDRRDTVPAALEAAGGRIEHFGMPVDPGNLLLIGSCEGRPVIGAPGCARSIAENGFDFVLDRILAGLPVSSRDIRRLGVGGLLGEIVTRPQPRGEVSA